MELRPYPDLCLRRGNGLLAWLVAALLLLLPAMAWASPKEDAVIEQRAHEAVEVLQGKREPASVFNAHFLAAVPPAQIVALGKQVQAESGAIAAVEDIRATGARSATFRIRYERAAAGATMTLESEAPFRISGLHIGPALPLGDSFAKIAADVAALPGGAGFVVARLDDAGPHRLAASRGSEPFAIGSAFKLWVLDGLAREIAAGRRQWDEVVRLGPRSLPGGITQDWPDDAAVTVETLATLMISHSDNTATDALVALVGRAPIEQRIRATHRDPARALPLLTTAEAFAIKLGPAAPREAYARADEAGRRRVLAGLDPHGVLAGVNRAELDGPPMAIDSAEWFASPDDVVRVLDALRGHDDPRVQAILGVAPNLDAAQRSALAYAGYKGGSEIGVLNLTWLLRDQAGAWFAVTASWNDPAQALDNAKLEALAHRLVMLARQGA